MTDDKKITMRRANGQPKLTGAEDWEQLDKDLRGLKTLCLMQLDMLKSLEREVSRMRRRRKSSSNGNGHVD